MDTIAPDLTEPRPARLSADRPLSIAILAMGGQGGGVLADWIVALAEGEGWVAQTTSVPGVAQRTGATIYYVEMLREKPGRTPVLSLMPTPGDVDVVLAAEWMEAGRSVLRGLVTPDRTVLVASTHRAYAVVEKEAPGDGVGDPAVVADATGFAARRTIAFDMDALAARHRSHISAALFGALAGSGALPFSRAAYETTIRAGGKGVEPSLDAFAAAFERAAGRPVDRVEKAAPKRLDAVPETAGHPDLDRLVHRIRAEFPPSCGPMLFAGAKRLVDFQDAAYAGAYLDATAELLRLDRAAGGERHGFAFTETAAKYLAVAMAYDDVIRVADLKIRASRFARLRREIGAKEGEIVGITEFMHPRMEEVCGTLPRRLGLFIEARPKLFSALGRVVDRGRRVRTHTIGGFLALALVAGRRRHRPGTLRHARERVHWESWLGTATATLPVNYDLAVEVLACRRLVKGYSNTHARGVSKFDRVLSALPLLLAREDGGAWLKRLRQAALHDEAGTALDGALKTVATL